MTSLCQQTRSKSTEYDMYTKSERSNTLHKPVGCKAYPEDSLRVHLTRVFESRCPEQGETVGDVQSAHVHCQEPCSHSQPKSEQPCRFDPAFPGKEARRSFGPVTASPNPALARRSSTGQKGIGVTSPEKVLNPARMTERIVRHEARTRRRLNFRRQPPLLAVMNPGASSFV